MSISTNMIRRYEKKRQSLPRARSLRAFARCVASLLANATVLKDVWRLRLGVLLGWRLMPGAQNRFLRPKWYCSELLELPHKMYQDEN